MINYSPVYKPSETFHLEQLKKESGYCINHIKSLHEEIERMEKYLSVITQRAMEIMQYEYYYIVYVDRREGYTDKKISYNVRVNKCVKGMNDRSTSMQVDFCSTSGRTGKKEALQKANEFKIKYNAIEIKTYF